MNPKPVVYGCDVGSIRKGNFAWASSKEKEPSTDIIKLVDSLVSYLRMGQKVAVGFECPLSIPCPEDPNLLGTARSGEGSRSWSAGAGPSAALTGIAQLGWVLREVRAKVDQVTATTRWDEFVREDGPTIYIWEAFVSGSAKKTSHGGDATVALQTFEEFLEDSSWTNSDIYCESPISLAGAIILWAGLADDTSLLHNACMVFKAT